MRIRIWLVLCLFIGYIHHSENLKILKKIHDFLHPTKPPTTSAPVSQTYKNEWHECESTTSIPWSGGEVSGSSGSAFDHNNPPKNEHGRENSLNLQPQLQNNNMEQSTSSDDGSGRLDVRVATSYNNSDVNNAFTQQNIPYSDNKNTFETNIEKSNNEISSFELTTASQLYSANDNGANSSQTQPTYSNKINPQNIYTQQQQPINTSHDSPSPTIQKGDHQTQIDSNNTNSNNLHPIICNTENSFCKENKTSVQNNQIQPIFVNKKAGQGQGTIIQHDEGGPIVFPTEPETDAIPTLEEKYQNDLLKTQKHSGVTTVRSAKAHVPVPDDGGRRVIDTPEKDCGVGRRLDDRGICRDAARK